MDKVIEIAIKDTVDAMYDNIIAYIEELKTKHLDYEFILEQAQRDKDGTD